MKRYVACGMCRWPGVPEPQEFWTKPFKVQDGSTPEAAVPFELIKANHFSKVLGMYEIRIYELPDQPFTVLSN